MHGGEGELAVEDEKKEKEDEPPAAPKTDPRLLPGGGIIPADFVVHGDTAWGPHGQNKGTIDLRKLKRDLDAEEAREARPRAPPMGSFAPPRGAAEGASRARVAAGLRRRRAVRGARRSLYGYRPPPSVPNPQAALTTQQMQVSLAVDDAHRSYTHLIEGNFAPVGRVHLVRMGPQTGDEQDNHILAQMSADSNMGAKKLHARRGPFKHSGGSGRSRIMDRSAHVSYRRRGMTLEITIRRNVTEYELDTVFAKLGAHRIGSHGALLFIIKGRSEKKLGSLDRVDFSKLRDMVYDCLKTYGVAGILVVDTVRRGALHKGYTHGMEMKESLRQADFGSK